MGYPNSPIPIENWPRRESPGRAFQEIAQKHYLTLGGITNGIDPLSLGLTRELFGPIRGVEDPYELFRRVWNETSGGIELKTHQAFHATKARFPDVKIDLKNISN